MKDLGWVRSDERCEFELNQSEHDLIELLRRLMDEAGAILAAAVAPKLVIAASNRSR